MAYVEEKIKMIATGIQLQLSNRKIIAASLLLVRLNIKLFGPQGE
jgi:hypothetical protein